MVNLSLKRALKTKNETFENVSIFEFDFIKMRECFEVRPEFLFLYSEFALIRLPHPTRIFSPIRNQNFYQES